MKTHLVCMTTLSLTLGLLAGAVAGEKPNPQDRQVVVKGVNTFAFDLYARLTGEQQGNLIYSPYSISTALGMCSAGARGETAAQMKKVLHLPDMTEQTAAGYADLIQELNGRGQPRLFQMLTTNALWPQQGFPFHAAYVNLLRDRFAANVREMDYKGNLEGSRLEINRFVAEQTKDKIPELFAPGTLTPDARLVLTNTIYFKADWLVPFEKEATYPQEFHLAGGSAVKVPMMHKSMTFAYQENNLFQAIELPYKDRDVSMLVILPRKKDGLAEVEKALPKELLAQGLTGVEQQRVILSLPKFKFSSSFTLNSTLASMGMPLAFSQNGADFSGMTDHLPLWIGVVVHKAVIEVDEKGTEAAAATGISMKTGSAAPREEPKTFTADHPFLFVLRDHRTGCILFMGRVTNPQKS